MPLDHGRHRTTREQGTNHGSFGMCIPSYKYLMPRNRMSLVNDILFLVGDDIRMTLRLADIEAVYWCYLGLGIGCEEEFYILCRRDDGVIVPDYVDYRIRLDLGVGAIPLTRIAVALPPFRMRRRMLGFIPDSTPRFAAYPRRDIDALIAKSQPIKDPP